MDAATSNRHSQVVADSMRAEISVLTASLGRLKRIMAAEVDEDCVCDNCAGFSVAIYMGDALWKHLQEVVEWLEVPTEDTAST